MTLQPEPVTLQPELVTLQQHIKTGLESLPLELVYLVMTFLPPESCAALSLVSKAFYWNCGQSLNSLADSAVKQRFFLLVERDATFAALSPLPSIHRE